MGAKRMGQCFGEKKAMKYEKELGLIPGNAPERNWVKGEDCGRPWRVTLSNGEV
jgi:hypothetical protein